MKTYTDLRSAHSKGYASASDDAWGHNAVCAADGHIWPCDTARALDLVEQMRGDVHHHINPAIGILRWNFQGTTGVDPFAVPNDTSGFPSTDGLPKNMRISTNVIVHLARSLRGTTDAADALLGEAPLRDRIAALQAQIADAPKNGPVV